MTIPGAGDFILFPQRKRCPLLVGEPHLPLRTRFKVETAPKGRPVPTLRMPRGGRQRRAWTLRSAPPWAGPTRPTRVAEPLSPLPSRGGRPRAGRRDPAPAAPVRPLTPMAAGRPGPAQRRGEPRAASPAPGGAAGSTRGGW